MTATRIATVRHLYVISYSVSGRARGHTYAEPEDLAEQRAELKARGWTVDGPEDPR
ncbi:hypothetical protein [Nonomuraea turkmeniaca]|uniref:hypothetical protein n=1 Tax=Nonomuraea turkmeniaca TaxID=103838 RepID=UPI00147706FF|nr:hypothetical protein [Nonomuraea turkmeniaca]